MANNAFSQRLSGMKPNPLLRGGGDKSPLWASSTSSLELTDWSGPDLDSATDEERDPKRGKEKEKQQRLEHPSAVGHEPPRFPSRIEEHDGKYGYQQAATRSPSLNPVPASPLERYSNAQESWDGHCRKGSQPPKPPHNCEHENHQKPSPSPPPATPSRKPTYALSIWPRDNQPRSPCQTQAGGSDGPKLSANMPDRFPPTPTSVKTPKTPWTPFPISSLSPPQSSASTTATTATTLWADNDNRDSCGSTLPPQYYRQQHHITPSKHMSSKDTTAVSPTYKSPGPPPSSPPPPRPLPATPNSNPDNSKARLELSKQQATTYVNDLLPPSQMELPDTTDSSVQGQQPWRQAQWWPASSITPWDSHSVAARDDSNGPTTPRRVGGMVAGAGVRDNIKEEREKEGEAVAASFKQRAIQIRHELTERQEQIRANERLSAEEKEKVLVAEGERFAKKLQNCAVEEGWVTFDQAQNTYKYAVNPHEMNSSVRHIFESYPWVLPRPGPTSASALVQTASVPTGRSSNSNSSQETSTISWMSKLTNKFINTLLSVPDDPELKSYSSRQACIEDNMNTTLLSPPGYGPTRMKRLQCSLPAHADTGARTNGVSVDWAKGDFGRERRERKEKERKEKEAKKKMKTEKKIDSGASAESNKTPMPAISSPISIRVPEVHGIQHPSQQQHAPMQKTKLSESTIVSNDAFQLEQGPGVMNNGKQGKRKEEICGDGASSSATTTWPTQSELYGLPYTRY